MLIQTGITRSSPDLTDGEILWPEERSKSKDMIRSFTSNSAYANFLEDEIGSLQGGKKTDLIVLDQDLFKIISEAIVKADVLLTMVEGAIIYNDSDFLGGTQ